LSAPLENGEQVSLATLLFVDDEPSILSALRRLMRKTPYECLFANSGKEALEILENSSVDVVISDMKMPEMSGDQLLAEVAKHYPETVRIVLSGYSEEKMVMAAINEGRIWGFIHKPWNETELRQAIEQAVFTQQVVAERSLLSALLRNIVPILKKRLKGLLALPSTCSSSTTLSSGQPPALLLYLSWAKAVQAKKSPLRRSIKEATEKKRRLSRSIVQQYQAS